MDADFGPYRLIRRLGVGGMGEVWLAERSVLGGATKRVALKVLRPDCLDNPKLRRMFMAEARLAMMMNHANIVQVSDVSQSSGGAHYMVMEYVEGLNLVELSRRLWSAGASVPVEVSAFVIGEILKALSCAHDFAHQGEIVQIIHRDISPHNVMLSIWGEVKVMDFGVARIASEDTSGVHVKGKLRYMPPEQVVDDARDPTSDLFAVGAVLHELLDGRTFRESTLDENRLIGMVIRGDVDDLRERDRLPAALVRLRDQLLQASPQARPQTAREAHRILAAWPGYADRSFELQALVRAHLRPLPRERPPRAEQSGVETRLYEPSASRSSFTSLPTAADSASTSHSDLRQPASDRRRRRLGISALALVTSVAVVGGVFARRSMWVGPAGRVALLDSELPARFAADTDRSWAPWRAIPPAPPEQTPPEQAPPERAPPERAPPKKQAQTVEPSAGMKVQLSAPSFFWVELRIAGSNYALDPMIKSRVNLWLAPGTYTVDYRTETKGTWTGAGAVVVDGEGTLDVRLTEGGELSRRGPETDSD